MEIATLATVATVVSGVAAAGGALVTGVASSNAAKYQNQVAQMNAQIAKDNAARALERSQIEQQDQDMLTRAQLATQEALQGASGLSLEGGSQMLTRKSAAQLGRRDALNIRQAGEMEAYGYKTQAANMEAEGRLAQAKGQSALLGSYFSAAGSLASSASQFGQSNFFKKKAA